MDACRFDGCRKPARSKGGLCGGHEQQQRRGRPLEPLRQARVGDEPLTNLGVRVTRACLAALGDQPGTRAREVLERWARRAR